MARRNRRIKSEVDSLLKKYQLTSPPINVEKIIHDMGIELQKEDLGEISGLLFRENSKVIIGANKTHAATRQRFTIAHELGHFLLHGNNQLFVDKVFAIKLRDHHSSEAVSTEEIEANAFAAELLMPAAMILREIQHVSGILDFVGDDLDVLIRKLASKFKVSQQAMTIRLMNLGVIQNSI